MTANLIEDASRHGGDKSKSKAVYEDGMARLSRHARECLTTDGRLVIVFANKQPDAWETLVSAIIRAGFVVDGSWPIQTEHARIESRSPSARVSHRPFGLSARSGRRRRGRDGTTT